MGARIIIETQNNIVDTTRMLRQRVYIRLFHPRIFMIQDEFFEDQFMRTKFKLIRRSEIDRSTHPSDMVHPQDVTPEMIRQLAAMTDQEINDYYEGLWVRYTEFWHDYKRLIVDYSLAKRDFFKACIDADIIGISMMVRVSDFRMLVFERDAAREMYSKKCSELGETQEKMKKLRKVIRNGIQTTKQTTRKAKKV